MQNICLVAQNPDSRFIAGIVSSLSLALQMGKQFPIYTMVARSRIFW